MVRKSKIVYVRAIRKQRFSTLCSMLEPHLEKSGTLKLPYNQSTGESVAYYLSENAKLCEKIVHSNRYKCKNKAKKNTICAPYEDYKMGFGGCGSFNKLLANKTWSYVVKRDRQVSSNYIFFLHCFECVSPFSRH